MKSSLWVFFLLFTLQAQEYTLEKLLDQAYRNSDAMAIAQLKMTNSELALSEMKRRMTPVGTIGSTFSHGIGTFTETNLTNLYQAYTPVPSTSVSYSGDTIITGMIDGLTGAIAPQRNNFSITGDIQQVLWAQNKLRHGVETLKISNRSYVCQWQEAKMNVKANLTRLFYQALMAQQRIRIEEESFERTKRVHTFIVDFYNAGMRNELDTLNSYIEFSSRDLSIREAKREYQEARQYIVAFANLPIPADSLSLLGELTPLSFTDTRESLEKKLLEENKTITTLQAQYDQSKVSVKLAKDDYFPTIFGGINFMFNSSYSDFNQLEISGESLEEHTNSSLYLGLNYELFSGGQRNMRVKQRQNESQMSFHQLEETKKRLLVNLNSLYDKLNEVRLRIEESERLLAASQRAYDIALDKYRTGLIRQIEYDDNTDKLRRAELFHTLAIYNYNSLVIDLRVLSADYLNE